MPKIQNIQRDTDISRSDKFLGSDSGGATRNYVIEDVSKFFKDTNAAGIAGQLTYQYKSTSPYPAGSMRVTFSTGSTFEKITSIKVSKFIQGEASNSYENLLTKVFATSQVLMVDVEDQDNFGIFDITTVVQDSSETDFYDIALSARKFNGSLTNEKIYAIISIGSGSDKHAALSFTSTDFAKTIDADGNVTYLTESINGSTMNYINWQHDLNKRPSITVAESGSPDQVAHVPVKYINDNTVKVYFTGTTSGKIYAN